jgi:tRNA(Ile)-lysidine synthase
LSDKCYLTINFVKRVDGDEGAGRGGRAALSGFARRLFAEWRRLGLPLTEACVVVAVSGGADSMALLLAFDELARAKRLSISAAVAHLNHKLRGDESDMDAQLVSDAARKLGCAVVIESEDVAARVARTNDNLEQAARIARYEFFARVSIKCQSRFVLLAHTLDDQAETVLMRLMRGSGADGLGGMQRVRPLAESGVSGVAGAQTSPLVVRPLLAWARRTETESYCRERGQGFRCDAMNADNRFARVRVRREVLPLLRVFNPRIEETLARTADLLREDASALQCYAEGLLRDAIDGAEICAGASVDARVLAAASPALQRRALRRWLEIERGNLRRIGEVHIKAVQSLLVGERGNRVIEIPGGGRIERRKGKLRFVM